MGRCGADAPHTGADEKRKKGSQIRLPLVVGERVISCGWEVD